MRVYFEVSVNLIGKNTYARESHCKSYPHFGWVDYVMQVHSLHEIKSQSQQSKIVNGILRFISANYDEPQQSSLCPLIFSLRTIPRFQNLFGSNQIGSKELLPLEVILLFACMLCRWHFKDIEPCLVNFQTFAGGDQFCLYLFSSESHFPWANIGRLGLVMDQMIMEKKKNIRVSAKVVQFWT